MTLGDDDDLRLRCFIEGETEAFSIDIEGPSWRNPKFEVDDLKKRIQEERKDSSLAGVDPHILTLWKPKEGNPINVYLDELAFIHGDEQLAEKLRSIRPVGYIFPKQPPLDYLHIIVQKPDTEGAFPWLNTADSFFATASPSSCSCRELRDREYVVGKAKGRPAPSSGAKLDKLRDVQTSSQADAIYNYRPLSLSAESVTIYHSVFAEFINDISAPLNSLDFSHEELAVAADVMKAVMRFYKIEDLRVAALRNAVGSTLDKELFVKSVLTASSGSGSTSAGPDGLLMVSCSMLPNQPVGYYYAQETKNESGEGGSDSVAQAECYYRAIVSRDEYAEVREASCCPMFLVSITGPLLTVSGAVFTDRLICQQLTDAIILGPRHSTVGDLTPLDEGQRKVAQLLRALRKGLGVLKRFYQTLKPTAVKRCVFPSPPQFQSYNDRLTGESYQLVYCERLVPEYPEKAVFRAISVGPQDTMEVVVKFTHRYGMAGHAKLAEMSLAPALRYCQRVPAVGMIVVVMDYVSGDIVEQGEPETWKEGLKKGLEVLHGSNLVFGDVRLPNLLMHNGAIKFIDFDWCGEEGVARYPGDLWGP